MTCREFTPIAMLDKSSAGTTMLARRSDSTKLFAIKILKKESTEIRFEDKLWSHIRHPFVLQFETLLESPTCIHLVMDFATGGYLMWHIQQGKFDMERSRLYATELCLAIKFFHDRGIVHRDLTLENVMLDSEGHIQVAGYELSKWHLWNDSKTSTFCGTSCFPAPEVLLDTGYGRPVDWWSLGIMLYQMICGKEPFFGEDLDEIYDAILDNEPLSDGLSADTVSIIQQLLIKDPDQRLGSSFSDAADVMGHLFFANLVWTDVYQKRIPVSFKPRVQNETDLTNFGLTVGSDHVLVKPCNDW